MKNVKFKIIIKIKSYLYNSENLNCAAQNLRLGHMRPAGGGLDIAVLNIDSSLCYDQSAFSFKK